MNGQIEALQNTIDQLTSRASKAEELLERNRESVMEYERRLQQSVSEMEKQSQKQSNISASASEREHEVRQMRAENDQLARMLSEAKEEVQRCRETIDTLKDRVTVLEDSERASRRLMTDARREAAETIRYSEDTHRRYEDRPTQDKRSREVDSRRSWETETDVYRYKVPESQRR